MPITLARARARYEYGPKTSAGNKIEIVTGRRGTLILKFDEVAIGLVQPKTKTKSDFDRAVMAAKLDLIPQIEKCARNQGIIYLAHDNAAGFGKTLQPIRSNGEAEYLANNRLSYEIEEQNGQPGDFLDHAVQFMKTWDEETLEDLRHFKELCLKP